VENPCHELVWTRAGGFDVDLERRKSFQGREIRIFNYVRLFRLSEVGGIGGVVP
jgi:hypothetical protein